MKTETLIIGGIIVFVLFIILVLSDRTQTFSSSDDFGWSYVKSPSGICYEVGANYRLRSYSHTISSPVDNSYCK